VRRGQVREAPLLELEPPARRIVHGPCCHPPEAGFDGGDGVGGGEQLLDVGLREKQGHTSSVPARTTIRSPSSRTTASHATASRNLLDGRSIPRCSSHPRRPTTTASTDGRPPPSDARRSRHLPSSRPDSVTTSRPRN